MTRATGVATSSGIDANARRITNDAGQRSDTDGFPR
jgi:hypothetical protein